VSVRQSVTSQKLLNEFRLNLVLMVYTKICWANLRIGQTQPIRYTQLKSNLIILLKVSHLTKTYYIM
jgi:hypothetical protein